MFIFDRVKTCCDPHVLVNRVNRCLSSKVAILSKVVMGPPAMVVLARAEPPGPRRERRVPTSCVAPSTHRPAPRWSPIIIKICLLPPRSYAAGEKERAARIFPSPAVASVALFDRACFFCETCTKFLCCNVKCYLIM